MFGGMTEIDKKVLWKEIWEEGWKEMWKER
jgi:hypothetical protein